MAKTYYKVVRCTHLGYRSAYYIGNGQIFDYPKRVEDADPKWLLPYELEEKTKPQVGKIFAFENERAAACFKSSSFNTNDKVVILKGTGKASRKQNYGKTNYFYVEKFWAEKRSVCVNNDVPSGTVYLDYFTPTERLTRA
jgi:hypothetical protein